MHANSTKPTLLTSDVFEVRLEEVPPRLEWLLDQRPAVNVQEVKRKQAHVHLHIFLSCVLALSRAQHLKRQNLVVDKVVRHCLAVEHKVPHFTLKCLAQHSRRGAGRGKAEKVSAGLMFVSADPNKAHC